MDPLLLFLQWICLIPAAGGTVYALLCLLAVARLQAQPMGPRRDTFSQWPPVTILKPMRGLEKNQQASVRSACLQDYPDFQVVFSVQVPDDPVIPLLREIQREFGPEKVAVAVENRQVGPNGKINNLIGALPYARHDILVISDSDVLLEPDYLKNIISPLADPDVGAVCTLYRAMGADRWFEKMELLTFNGDFVPSVIFAHLSKASKFCLGASLALRRSSLKEIGGFEALADYLVEDYEIGRRLWKSGHRVVLVPYFVKIVVDFKNRSEWWHHQIYWDQNTRAARPAGFFASIVTRSVPFGLFFALFRLGDGVGLAVLALVLGLRLATAGAIFARFRDREGLRSLPLLPFRDMVGLVSWFLAFTKRTVLWRGTRFRLTSDGRLCRKASPS